MSTNETNAPDINLDEFLPMPGAADILTAPESTKTTVFSKTPEVSTDFLDEKKKDDEEKAEEPKVDIEAAKQVLDEIISEPGQEEETKSTSGRPRFDKSGLVDTFSKLIDEGMLVPFDDEKPMEEYSMNYYPRHQEMDHLFKTLRFHGLYR